MEYRYRYSVIVPHRNIPELLARCLASVPVRPDTQIVVVDDCSDNCTQTDIISAAGGRSDVHFVFLDKCSGAGNARNEGLKEADAEYVLFADSDDFFMPALDDVLNRYKATDADIVYFRGCSKDTDTMAPAKRADQLNGFIDLYGRNAAKGELMLRYQFGEPWCKMVKREIIDRNGIGFDLTSIHNDTTFSYLVGHYASKVTVDETVLYCVTVRQGSVSKGTSDSKIMERMDVSVRAEKFFMDHGIPVRERRHYIQLWTDIQNGRKDLFRSGYGLLKKYGLSSCHIYRRLAGTLLIMIWKKITRK